MKNRYETRGVLAGVYQNSRGILRRPGARMLKHTVDLDAERSLCRVGFDHLADGPADGQELPTCPTCRRRDPRFKALQAPTTTTKSAG